MAPARPRPMWARFARPRSCAAGKREQSLGLFMTARRTRSRMVAVLPLLALGCGPGIPTDRISAAQGAIRAAKEVGGDKAPPGTLLHLQFAREGMKRARRLVADGDNTRAEWLLLCAEADAELALQLARETQAKEAAQKVLNEVRMRKSGGLVSGGKGGS
jgi:hypothetical protein